MNNERICILTFIPYLITIGIIAYIITPWALLIFLGGYKCKQYKNKEE